MAIQRQISTPSSPKHPNQLKRSSVLIHRLDPTFGSRQTKGSDGEDGSP